MSKGTYALVCLLPKTTEIKIGKLGKFTFPKGYYVYVGSAMNSLEARISRHLSKKKKLHWHIDYFLKHAKILKVLKKTGRFRYEGEVSRQIHSLSKRVVAKKFGASDCNCATHLYFFSKNPLTFKKFRRIFPG